MPDDCQFGFDATGVGGWCVRHRGWCTKTETPVITHVEFTFRGERYRIHDNRAYYELFVWEDDGTGLHGTGWRPLTDIFEEDLRRAYDHVCDRAWEATV